MTTYVFERITAAQAASFTADDALVFVDTNLSSVTVANAAATGLTQESTTISSGSLSVMFPAGTLASASQAGHLTFVSGGTLVLGTGDSATSTAADDNFTVTVTANPTVYAFSGNDQVTISDTATGSGTPVDSIIHGGAGNDVLNGGNGNDFIYGGLSSTTNGGSGADQINGGGGNDHIYGGDPTEGVTSTDGADTLYGGDGNDYINGNAGSDLIDGGNGDDRLLGGAGDDDIIGESGFDQINGNQGKDTIDGGDGNDNIRGGQDNDMLFGGVGQDLLMGDAGNDTITGSTGIDVVTGGAGTDVFVFTRGDSLDGANVEVVDASGATVVNAGGVAQTLAGFYDSITDFTVGTDKIEFQSIGDGGSSNDTLTSVQIVQAQPGVTFTSAAAAKTYAQQLLDTNQAAVTQYEVAAIQVGNATYLFAHEGNQNSSTQINSIIRLDGVSATTVTSTDFLLTGGNNSLSSFPL